MVLIDTSAWIVHLGSGDKVVDDLLRDGSVLSHPFVVGEIACGSLSDRVQILQDLQSLPRATIASNSEVMDLIESHRLYAKGIGWVDMHLLASALLSTAELLTRDRRLHAVAQTLNVAWSPRP